LAVGVIGVGEVRVTPVTASLTDAVDADAVSSDGRVGLAFVQAAALASSASALQVINNFNFMCSYRGFDRENAELLFFRDKGWATRRRC